MTPWIGFDLDGTIARDVVPYQHDVLGDPFPRMMALIKYALKKGVRVKIVTARVANPEKTKEREIEIAKTKKVIAAFTKKYVGEELEATSEKDYGMIALIDDRAINVENNAGRLSPKDTDYIMGVIDQWPSS